jgi:MEMO1 family protein
MPIPPIRATLRIVPFKHEGRDVFLVDDHQENLFENQIILPPLGFVVASFLDGEREAEDVLREILAKFPASGLQLEHVEGAVRDLDENFLLESEKAGKKRRDLETTYLALASRPSRFVAGGADEVEKELDGYYAAQAGAGRRGAARKEPLAGILAPHIDFRRGGHCYTFPYKELAERSDADVYVVLGVAHMSPPNPFVVTAKDYDTPFGPAKADRELIAALEKRLGDGIYENEAVHRAEHSAEFQAVFLKHARPKADFTVLPILCSSFAPWCEERSPRTVGRIADVLGALEEVLQDRKACVVAGVDFAHVGPVFGDPVEVDDKLVRWMVEEDSKSLKLCGAVDPEGFWSSIMADGNARHVCGLSATYAALSLLPGTSGKLLKYGFAPDPAGGLVSFAGMSFAPPA